MAQIDFASLLRAIPTLRPEQLTEIRKRVSMTLGIGGDKIMVTKTLEDDYLIDGIEAELRRRGVLKRNRHVSPTLLTDEVVAKSQEVRDHLKDCLGELSVADRIALGALAGRCLASYLVTRMPIIPATLIRNVDKVPAAIEVSYPGYLASNLLRLCWK